MSLSILSYGGGVQSTALLVLAARGEVQIDAALFANVGDDSEHPATLRYVRDVAAPFAAAHGVRLELLTRVNRRTGQVETLMQYLQRPGSRSVPIPVRMANGAPGTRSCTVDFKMRVIARWLKKNGATVADPATVLIGFSFDEVHRMGKVHNRPFETMTYPLIDRRLVRDQCAALIADAGLPVPPKSACYFCPYHRPTVWRDMARREPDLFEKAANLETMLNERRVVLGKDPVWLTRFNKPLREAIDTSQLELFPGGPGETCDEGYCWT
jgi:hypothetical protein